MLSVDLLDPILRSKRQERRGKPITFAIGPKGEMLPLSRYGDDIIDFGPYIQNPAALTSKIDLRWYPRKWRLAITDLIVAFWRYGRPGQASPKASTVVHVGVKLVRFVEHLADSGVERFRDVSPIHVTSYAKKLKETPHKKGVRKGQKRAPAGIRGQLNAICLLWELRAHLTDYISFRPFEDYGDLARAANHSRRDRKAKTYAMTPDEASRLFNVCEKELNNVEHDVVLYELMCDWRRDNPQGELKRSTYQDRWVEYARCCGFTDTKDIYDRISRIRAACLCEIGLLVGMRISELLLLEVGCYYEAQSDDETLGWLRGKSIKMRKRGAEEAEWIAPRRVGQLVSILERITRPLRKNVSEQIFRLERQFSSIPASRGGDRANVAKILERTKRVEKTLFLIEVRKRGIDSVEYVALAGSGAVSNWFAGLSRSAALKFRLTPHVLRRTFAVAVVNQCAGDIRYLRKHFHHWSIETTELYAAHEGREQDLADEIAEEMLNFKTDLVFEWLKDDTVLAGKNGQHIVRLREELTFKGQTLVDKKVLAKHLAQDLVIRPTGHSWCVSTGAPTCGGHGLYDARHCAGCDDAVVGPKHLRIWIQLGVQSLQLLNLNDCGPAAAQIVSTSVRHINEILGPFGTSLKAIAKASGAADVNIG